MPGANQANNSAPSTEAVNQAIATHHLRYWQASDAPGTHSLASIANWMGGCSKYPNPGDTLNGKSGLATQLGLAEPLELEPYTKVTIEVHKRAFSFFNPAEQSANEYMKGKSHRMVKLYRARHPQHGVATSFTTIIESKKFFTKQTIGTVTLHRLTNIGEEHLLKCVAMPPNFSRAMSIEVKLDRCMDLDTPFACSPVRLFAHLSDSLALILAPPP